MHVPVKKAWDIAKETAEAAAKALNIDAAGVLVGSTGVIGMQLPMQKLVDGIQVLSRKNAEGLQSGHDAALLQS